MAGRGPQEALPGGMFYTGSELESEEGGSGQNLRELKNSAIKLAK